MLLAAVLGATCATGCGGGTQASATAPSLTPSVERPQHHGCTFLDPGDVVQVTGGDEPKQIDLAPPRGSDQICATAFAGGDGSLVVAVSERKGGGARLRALRQAAIEQFGARSVRDVPALGPGAFVVRARSLTFRRGDRVATVETGYDARGKLALTGAELARLASTVADRL